ncbi:hypothetical protein HQN85_01065 [Pedobacter boryungensis]|uniref:Uncharacterized protein n=1 Tax=Pedobacter boryungensis TaxID=869962 RepID=A0ABX2D8F6_9SPHI|nr:hypothetical protein [Pedobacter boryungensis]
MAQTKDFTEEEEKNYNTIKSLFEHFKDKGYDSAQRDFVFKHFVYFDNVLADTSKTQILKRTKFFDELFSQMIHYVDSVGMENLDAAPTRLFKDNPTFFKSFEAESDLNKFLPFTLTYYDKRRPREPIGVLLFEPKTHKLLTWILLNQGGYYYFLTFNLL